MHKLYLNRFLSCDRLKQIWITLSCGLAKAIAFINQPLKRSPQSISLWDDRPSPFTPTSLLTFLPLEDGAVSALPCFEFGELVLVKG